MWLRGILGATASTIHLQPNLWLDGLDFILSLFQCVLYRKIFSGELVGIIIIKLSDGLRLGPLYFCFGFYLSVFLIQLGDNSSLLFVFSFFYFLLGIVCLQLFTYGNGAQWNRLCMIIFSFIYALGVKKVCKWGHFHIQINTPQQVVKWLHTSHSKWQYSFHTVMLSIRSWVWQPRPPFKFKKKKSCGPQIHDPNCSFF